MSLLYHRFAAFSLDEQRRIRLCALAGVVFLFHYLWYSNWLIEDAAISFSFARNVAMGDGFVAYPGGERVEGFSNPTWTLLLAAGEWIGLSSWFMSKFWGAAFGLFGLVLSMQWCQFVRRNNTDVFACLAPFLLAMSPHYVLWTASGLENALLMALMAFGCVLLCERSSNPRNRGRRSFGHL